jgi:hypothetical protein
MGQTYDIDETQVNALRAIVARLDGEWDNPHLIAAGSVHSNPEVDIRRIAEDAVRDFEITNYQSC